MIGSLACLWGPPAGLLLGGGFVLGAQQCSLEPIIFQRLVGYDDNTYIQTDRQIATPCMAWPIKTYSLMSPTVTFFWLCNDTNNMVHFR